ncbi:MAG: CBS domain-containing protein, partial [Acidimicrobiales bacterium]|nr:CBS domain-containing protein [Acidimicrobiales bacterium]
FNAMGWVVEQDGLGLIALLAGCKIGATLATLLGGGVGGLFIPLATMGVIAGQFVGVALDESETTLYPTLGLAAFLGAGYRAPLTAVMFVAESTGGGGFVVPALIAAAFSQVVTGRESVSGHQIEERLGHLEARLALPLTAALSTDVMTVPPDATVAEFMYLHVLGRRQTNVPVVDGAQFVGIVRLANLVDVDRAEWEATTIVEVCETDLPVARPGWTLRDAATAMEQADMDVLAVADHDDNFIGVVREDELVRLDEILDQTS